MSGKNCGLFYRGRAGAEQQCGPRPQEGHWRHLAWCVGGTSGCPALGLAVTAAQWGQGWEQGSGLRGGGSESASCAQHMLRFTVWSAVSRGVCAPSRLGQSFSHWALTSSEWGVGQKHTLNGWGESTWAGCLVEPSACVHEWCCSPDRILQATATGLDRWLTMPCAHLRTRRPL